MSTAAFSETLQFITNVKLSELNKRSDKFAEHSSQVLDQANSHAGNDPIACLEGYLRGLRAWPRAQSDNFNLRNIDHYLQQARRDPGFPPTIIDEWNRQAEAQFKHEGLRFDFARLFGMLVDDWLKSKAPNRQDLVAVTSEIERRQSANSDDFEKVGRKETIEQKEKLESLIFEEKKIDVDGLKSYLEELFSSKEAKEALKELRLAISTFASRLKMRTISVTELKKVIKSVLRTDVLSEKKQATLKEFLQNDTIMDELASVLNMQLASVKSWSWPVDGVALEPRRHLNGRTRFFLDSEILTCLLLQYLGTLWSIEFKKRLLSIVNSRAWKQFPKKLNAEDHVRRDIFFQNESRSVNKLRREYNVDHFFMCQLPDDFEVVDHYEKNTATRYRSIVEKSRGPQFDTPVNLKQSLLHILSADIALNKAHYEKCTVVRTDLEWFGPSLPFETITTILEFFGTPGEDINFVKSFLSCPIIFRDDPSRQVRVRKRGVPLSYMFSTLFGELTMFIMDFAVNQRADGLFLHRIHDDFWFWDVDGSRCVAAWTEMQRYASLAGLKFNMEKTGSAVIGNVDKPEGLPSGEIRWGFLVMDVAQDGRFKVDQEMIDKHITEMRRQLASTPSIFQWIQAYNKYMSFIVRNCGEPAIIFGQKHIDDIINSLARIQKSLFAGGDDDHSTVATAVAKMIKEKFDVSAEDIPYGWYLWPNAAGGLELKDPFVELFLLRDGYTRSIKSVVDYASREDERKYSAAKRHWESTDSTDRKLKLARISSASVPGSKDVVSSKDPFFSFEEFTKSWEERGAWWADAYQWLLERPVQSTVACTPGLEASLKLLGNGLSSFGGESWRSLRPYWQWVVALHHDEMVKKFGGLAVVDPKTVPVGMVSVFKTSRVKWEQ